MVKDKRHARKKEICMVLRTILQQMKQAGYVPYVGSNEFDEDEQQKEDDILSSYQIEMLDAGGDQVVLANLNMDRLVQNGTKEVVGNRLAKKKLEKVDS